MDTIVLTHGHEDHLGDTVRLAQKYGATVVGQYEVCMYVNGLGVGQLDPMNTGGAIEREGMPLRNGAGVPQLGPDPGQGSRSPVGIRQGSVIQADGKSIYHTGDTALFSDMALIQRIYRPTVGLICIGDRFASGARDRAIACNEFLDLELIVPIHWGTFGLLSGRPEDFQQRVHRGCVRIATPGEPLEL